MTATADTILARYATDIAFVADDEPATTLDRLADQLMDASVTLDDAGITGAEELDVAATYLRDAEDAAPEARDVLLNKASQHLTDTTGMVAEYRLSV
ncbi:hypothetical protein [Streptomyces sp. NPDC050848]|uniref:hypothetical protein n=1 Tax=Streptomyces sp. NPDC050848 TaxID=3155791 RepID=UPI0033D48896